MVPPPDDLERPLSQQAFRAGVLGNVFLAATKLAAGAHAGLPALMADGWHSLADAATNATAWIVDALAQGEPDEDHHYGHGKLEALASLAVGLLILAGGVTLAASAFDFGELPQAGWPLWIAFVVAVLSIVVNLVLARAARKAATEEHAGLLQVLFRDNLSDALASGLVVIAILGSLAELPWAEPVATFVIGLGVVVMGVRSARSGFDVLMDRSDPDLRVTILRSARSVDGVRWVQRVRARPIGGRILVDLDVSVNGTMSVEEGHTLAHLVEEAVTRDHPLVREVHVHVQPGPPGSNTPGTGSPTTT